jgi:Fe-S cluster assembly protein SufD
MKLHHKNINEITVRTFNWLQVNNVNIEFEKDTQKSEYNKNYFENTNLQGVTLSKYDDKTSKITSYCGVDEKLLNENLTNFNAGFKFQLDKNTIVPENIHISFNLDEKNQTLLDTNIIDVSENSEVTLYITYYGEQDINGYHQTHTTINIAKNSNVKIIFVQSLSNKTVNIQSILANVSDNSKISFVLAEIGSQSTIVNLSVNLNGDCSESEINAIYLANNDKKVDLNYTTNHFGINTNSVSETKGVLLDNSKKIFKGGIKFNRGAKGSEGSLLEDVLLLSPTAKNSTIPLLLCDEDDVQGAHAASVGRLDEDVLFYLMTRGLDEDDAKKLFLECFFNPVLDLIDDENIKSKIRQNIKIEVSKNA